MTTMRQLAALQQQQQQKHAAATRPTSAVRSPAVAPTIAIQPRQIMPGLDKSLYRTARQASTSAAQRSMTDGEARRPPIAIGNYDSD